MKKAYLQELSLSFKAKEIETTWFNSLYRTEEEGWLIAGDNKFKKTSESEDAKQAHFSVLTGSEGELLTAPESFLVRKGLEVWVKGWNEHGNLGNGSFKDLACFEPWPFQVDENLKIALEGAYVLLY